MRRAFVLAIPVCVASLGGKPAQAIEFEWSEAQFSWKNKFTVGAGIRTEERDPSRLGKLNVPGQQSMCVVDDCLSLAGDPAPNQRLVNSSGGYFLHATDDGNMNYDKGDFYSLLAKLNTDLTADLGEWTFKASMVNFFDQANAGFDDQHNNTLWQPQSVPRLGEVQHRIAVRGEFRELFAATSFPLLERDIGFSVGWQRLRWGESNLHLLNTLDVINPQDAVLARQPGLNLNELNVPTNMVILGTELFGTVSGEVFYQLEWQPVRPEPAGSFFSTSDVAGGGNYAILGQGNYPEDPPGAPFYSSQGEVGQLSSSTRLAEVLGEDFGAPRDMGQFGLRINWLSDWNDGTELAFYFANYHSRLPYLSVLAAGRTCLRDAAEPNIVEAYIACNGFRGNLGLPQPDPSSPRGEPLPVDSLKVFLDYPEDIQMYGVSFNTPVAGWAVSGEYSYRPNVPIQLLLTDVIFAGEQPAFANEDIPLNPTGLSCDTAPAPAQAACVQVLNALLVGATGISPDAVIPGRRRYVPDLITPYRGQSDIAAGEYVPGFERVAMSQFTLTALKLYPSSNPFDADSILLVLEGGFSFVHDLPKGLYFQGNGDHTHPTTGADCTGHPAGTDCSSPEVVGTSNPTQETGGFADEFSYGARMLLQFTYENAWDSGVNVKPSVLWFEDLGGIAPSPQQNYVEGNQFIVGGAFLEIGQDWAGTFLYQWHRGERNLLSDRDNLSFTLSYSF